ncbi:MAG TPA: prepilin-type N-terminal cleavage/methylation domain-containing protein [Bacteriovoracaceae bacterium]|nr:prepilin-type N-terminal cleavage/methylation domain-containing protein [Bacteriovoracaceae bacterium]
MKMFPTPLKRQDGFTLVELMVVVAIIGLLSAVAIPNFKKYQAKSKVSEAKLQLSAIFTAETAFFSDFNMYGACLPYMGYDPGPETNGRYFATGFVTGGAIAAGAMNSARNSGLDDTPATGCEASSNGEVSAQIASSPNNSRFFAAGKGVGSSIANGVGYLAGARPLPAGRTVSIGTQGGTADMWFLAGAGGVVSADNGGSAAGTNAFLTINEQKNIQIITQGY